MRRRLIPTAASSRPTDPVFAGGGVAGEAVANGVSRVDPRTYVAAGDRVTFVVDVGALHLFDPQTGETLDEVALDREGARPLRALVRRR